MRKPSLGQSLGGWKPYTMQAPVLISVIIITLLLAGIIEFLAQKSQRQGGLALSELPDPHSGIVTFGYLYAPTVISVLYSLLWSWIDLDIRRIQPWLELSRQEGATADSSLLLDYPNTFLAFIPFLAWKKGHWPVFFSGIASMLLFWAITPLQSSIMGLKPITFATNITVSSPLHLPPPQEQAMMMDTTVLHASYGMAWLEQAPLPFTTADYALVPFSRADTSVATLPSENLTAITTMLTTELDCWEASISKLPPVRSYLFDNGRGCTMNVGLFQSHPYENESSLIVYMGYYESPILDYYLHNPNCSQEFSNQFLVLSAHLSTNPTNGLYETNMTGLFCETLYYKQPVSVTVSAESGRPLNDTLVFVGAKEELTQDEFNSTALDYLMGVGMPPPTPTRDYPAANTFDPWASLAQKDVAQPVTPMVNLALGLSDYPASEYQNATVLIEAFTTAHKMVFSAAISRLFSGSEKTKLETGTSHYVLYGEVVSRTISAMLEGLLLLLAILMGGVLYTSMKATSKLVADPATIGFAFRSVRTSRAVLDRLVMEDCSDTATLRRSLAGEQFFLEKRGSGNFLEIESKEDENPKANSRKKEIKYTPTRPKELHPLTGCLLVIILFAGAGVLIYFKITEKNLQGLPRPSENFEVLQLLENYIPTIFVTLLEPFLVLLTRIFCILQPFNTLHKGKCNPEHTLETKYTSLPPQLVLWRAIRSGHLLLTTLSVMALLVNVLTVALGGTFNELPIQKQYPVTFNDIRGTGLTRDTLLDTRYLSIGNYYDHFYAASTNISHNTTLPPWVTTQYTFLPVNETVQPSTSSDLYRAKLRGFGVDTKCEAMSSSPTTDSRAFANVTALLRGSGRRSENDTQATFNFLRDNGTWTPCYPTAILTGLDPKGQSAREVVTPLWPISFYAYRTYKPYEDHYCEDKFVVGWLRANSEDLNNTFQSSFLYCESALQTAMFDVDFDRAGHILAYNRSGEFDDITQFMSLNMSQTLVLQANDLINDIGRPGIDSAWHNGTMVVDWWNYLLKSLMQTTDLVDPSVKVPKPKKVIPVVEELYQRLFAILLGKNLDLFEESTKPTNISGVVVVTETRIFLNDTAFLISVVILCLNGVVLVWVYLSQSDAYLPRLPSTLGSLLAYTAASRAVREYGDGSSGASDEESWHRKAFPGTYSFGRYLGVDGNLHIGIEMDPFVTPVDGTMLNRSSTAKSWLQRKKEEES